MLWRSSRSGDPLPPAQAFCRVHERWLSWAMQPGRRFPTIPTIRVDHGGFDPLLQRPAGRAAAEQWWETTLAHMGGPADDAMHDDPGS